MNKITLVRTAAATLSSLGLAVGLSGGMAGASTTGTIHNTGPDSHNVVTSTTKTTTDVTNHNSLYATNNNPQTAHTGSVEVEHNTTGGDASSGWATNNSALHASVSYDNSSATSMPSSGGSGGSMDATISQTGPDSYNKVTQKNTTSTTVTNTNDVHVTNNNTQNATTGSASVEGNTTGGNATSGDATNNSTFDLSVNVTN